ncbi:MAG: sigma-70 family RNA polymerase sigma factor [Alphaproteobacteria bacterium]|nr:sigma-70 family RNA polymerase sigma factor [Alphaproteobacteria bacterium]
MTAPLKQRLVELLPDLRSFARSLVRDPEQADDLVQETLLRALSALDTFKEGTNLGAWTFTILRNHFYSQWRKQRRVDVGPISDDIMPREHAGTAQEARLQLRDLKNAFWRLPPEQREALVLVAMRGLKYEDAAAICGCAVGTMKARVSRARAKLQSEVMDQAESPGS